MAEVTMHRMRPKGYIVLDIGGTLADLHSIAMKAVRLMVSRQGREIRAKTVVGVCKQFEAYRFSSFYLNEDAIGELMKLGGGPVRRRALGLYRRYALSLLEGEVEPERIVRLLRRKGYRLIIATNGTRESTMAIMEALRINRLVYKQDIYISEEYGREKGSGIIHREIRKRCGRGRIWAVGDSIGEDLEPAAKVGMIPIWMTGFRRGGEKGESIPKDTIRIRGIGELEAVFA